MPIDPQQLAQVLRTPEKQDVTETPLVTAVILTEPKNAADLVPALARYDTLEARNARKILCLFGPEAVPFLLTALIAETNVDARQAGTEILFAMFAGQPAFRVREVLRSVEAPLATLLEDKRELPDRDPPLVERDFHGRLCDLAYILVRLAADKTFDQSGFRGRDDTGRDREITRWRQQGAIS